MSDLDVQRRLLAIEKRLERVSALPATNDLLCVIGVSDSMVASYSMTTASVRFGVVRGDAPVLLTRAQVTYFTGALNSGASYHSFGVYTSASELVWSFDTSADAASSNITKSTTTFAAQPAAAINWLRLDLSVTGAPGSLFPRIVYVWYHYA